MDEFDDKLQQALRSGQRIEIGADEIGTARGLIAEIFCFRSKLIAVTSVVKIATAWVLASVCAIMTFVADGERARFLWGFGSLFALVSLGILWQFHWLMLNRNAVLRELKRLELRITTRT